MLTDTLNHAPLKWNRTTMGDNTVTGLVMIAVLIQGIAMAYSNFYCVSGKAGDYV